MERFVVIEGGAEVRQTWEVAEQSPEATDNGHQAVWSLNLDKSYFRLCLLSC